MENDPPQNGRKAGGRPRNRATDEAIVRAALELFIEKGADGASIEKIARRAGTTRAAVYRRYKSKEDLLVQAIGSVREEAEKRLGRWQNMELPEFLALLTSDEVIGMFLNRDYLRLTAQLVGSMPGSPEIMAAYREVYLAPRIETMRKMLRQAREREDVPADMDVEIACDMLQGALLSRLLLHPAPSEDEMRAYIVRLLAGLGLAKP